MDVWSTAVPTNSYSSSGFACLPGAPGPAPAVASPDQAVQGQTLSVYVSGENFRTGATVASDSSLAFSNTRFFSDRLLLTSLSVPVLSSPGSHVITVTNPDGTSGTVQNAFTVIVNHPPSISIFAPEQGTVVTGPLTIAASASDDVGVQSVAFLLDGVNMATVTSYPFRWTLDGTSLANGAHTITAKATDQGGLTADASVVVYKNPPVLESYQRLSSPFRIKIRGANFEAGCQVFIGSDAAPWGNVVFRNSGALILKRGEALKARFPKGVPVTILIKNSNGTQGHGTITLP